MVWEYFFYQYKDWDLETIRQGIGELTDIGEEKEIVEVIVDIIDEPTGALLVKKALKAGVRFSKEDIIELLGSLDDKEIGMLVKNLHDEGVRFTRDEILELYGFIENHLLSEIVIHSPSSFYEDDLAELEEYISYRAYQILKEKRF